MRLAVDAARETADDDEPGRGELAAEHCARPGAPYGEQARAPTIATAGRASSSRSASPRRKSPGGGSWIARSSGGKPGRSGRASGSRARPGARAPRARRTRLERREAGAARLADEVRVVRGRERGQRELVHAASSFGERYASASATCSGSTASAPASAAAVRATRATRARPRPESGSRSTARLEQLVGRRRPLRRARRPAARAGRQRARGPAPTPRPARPRARSARGRGTVTTRSKRSRSARESLSRNAASRCGEHEHSAAGSPRPAHGHRFIVADELEPGREERLARRPRDRDDAVLERLPQRLERGPLELGQLVEQQHAAMREARLAGPRPGAAADDRRRRGAVVRRAERRAA